MVKPIMNKGLEIGPLKSPKYKVTFFLPVKFFLTVSTQVFTPPLKFFTLKFVVIFLCQAL
jgi:hypothetical protein